MADQLEFKKDLEAVIIRLQTMLIEKNVKYGDAALNPNQIFSKCSPMELINVRIDDKLSRIRVGAADEDEDPMWDLLGYLVLREIAKKRARLAELNAVLSPRSRSRVTMPSIDDNGVGDNGGRYDYDPLTGQPL